MKIHISSVFNEDGDDSPVSHKRPFLSQRKWIIGAALFVALVSNGYLSIDRSWLIVSFDINYTAVPLLKGVSVTALLFGVYMVLSLFPYVKKHRRDNLAVFEQLELEEKSLYTDQVASLEKQRSSSEKTLAEAESRRIELLDAVRTADLEFNNAKLKFEEAKLKNANPLLGTDSTATSEIISSLTKEASRNYQLAQRDVQRADQNLDLLLDQMDKHDKSLESLRKEQQKISSEISAALSARQQVFGETAQSWRMYYTTRVGADLVSLVPTIYALGYCGNFLVNGS